MTSKVLIIILIASFLAIFLAIILGRNISNQNPPIPKPQRTIDTQTTQKQALPSPIKASKNQGVVLSLENDNLEIRSGNETQTFSIASTSDYQRILSGTFDGGDAKLAQAKKSDLKVGQNVLVILDKNTGKTVSVFILP